MSEFKNTSTGDYAQIIKQSDGRFCVLLGYFHDSFEAYGNETITHRKVYATEKAAIRKAQQHTS